MSYNLKCPYCEQDVEITRIRTSDRLSYKYMNISSAVGICPNCKHEVHIPDIDSIIDGFKILNARYTQMLDSYTNASSINKDTSFADEWPTKNEFTFDTDTFGDSTTIVNELCVYGTLKTELGFDLISISDYDKSALYEIINDVIEDSSYEGKFYFKGFINKHKADGSLDEICCMMWINVTGKISGIVFNRDDYYAYKYGKQKTKDKYII